MLQMKSSNVGGRAIRNSPIVWSFVTESTVFDIDTTRTKRSCDQEVWRAGISANHKSTCGNEHASPESKTPTRTCDHDDGFHKQNQKGPAASMMGWVLVRRQQNKTSRRTSGWALSPKRKAPAVMAMGAHQQQHPPCPTSLHRSPRRQPPCISWVVPIPHMGLAGVRIGY